MCAPDEQSRVILSHRHRFIFVKTAKTAGTSLKVALADLCGPEDVVPPIMDRAHDIRPRNHLGRVNPMPELRTARRAGLPQGAAGTREMLLRGRCFSGHTPAWVIRARAPREWESYTTFCVERNPWDKVLSGRAWVRTQYGKDWDIDTYLDWVEAHIAARRPGTGVAPFNFGNYTDPCSGEPMVDHILRYEHLADELPPVLERLGLPPLELPRIYGGRRRPGDEALSPAQVGRIGVLFAPEVDLFGYEPPATVTAS